MTNDAKLGMLVGVLGVVVAAVLFANPAPPQPAEQAVQPTPPRSAAVAVAPLATSVAAAPAESARDREPLPTTPVARPRKEPTAQTVSRPLDTDEEP